MKLAKWWVVFAGEVDMPENHDGKLMGKSISGKKTRKLLVSRETMLTIPWKSSRLLKL